MKDDHEMLLLWLTDVWAERKCLPGAARLDPLHAVWRSHWKFCARHGCAPLPVERWAAACAALTNGAVAVVELGDGGGIALASEARETVREALRTGKKKAAHRIRRKVSK